MTEEKHTRRTHEQMEQFRKEKITQLEASIIELEEKKAAIIAAFDGKIEKARKKITVLKETNGPKKPGPKPIKRRRTKAEMVQELVKQARKSGMSLDEIALKLGIEP